MPDPTPPPDRTGGINISGGTVSAGRDIVGGDVIYNIGTGGPPLPPSDVPHLWNVPHLQNPNFVGRTADLKNLRRRFDESSRIQTITGLGGIGKTSLVVEYCFRNQDAYDIVWWLRAGDSSALATDYAALAPKLDPALAASTTTSKPRRPCLVRARRPQARRIHQGLD